jgi:hypothetical protein
MASDRARVTFDPDRRYHGVVKEQGRVELEADENEAFTIIAEAERLEAIDIIGPAGTPDNGYEITDGGLPPFDFNIGPGTMYVGGMRVTQPLDKQPYSEQPDWVDHAGDPMWIDPEDATGEPFDYVYLFLREQEVSAAEDSALREVALGGPDTAQRLRLLQRVVRMGTNGKDCEDALEEAMKRWADEGLLFDPHTMMLESTARLKASYDNLNIAPDLCEPEAHGGYLEADNQLIRVQVTDAGKLVWGFDNASFLYRVKVIDDQTLELESTPVDSHHFPLAGQAVEVLRTAVVLDAGDYVASHTGIVMTLGASYVPDTRRITLPAALPAEYLDADETPQVFLRVWQEEADFVAGTAVDLGQTGLQVTLTGGAPFHAGDYWMIAVRPSTPTEVYPQRYLESPQPPEGPRLWVCPLAVLDWDNDPIVVSDCREHFDNLVELTKRQSEGCCTVTVGDGVNSKGEFQDIQQAIDHVSDLKMPVRVCILPGVYRLDGTVIIKGITDLTLCGCGPQAVIQMQGGDPAFFINLSKRITLDGLTITSSSELGAVFVTASDTVALVGCRIRNPRERDGFDVGPAVLVAADGDDPCTEFTITGCDLEGTPPAAIQAETVRVNRCHMEGGGVWLREGTADAIIHTNEIGPGAWPGVLLGGLHKDDRPVRGRVGVESVAIVRNQIRGLGASGITTAAGKIANDDRNELSLIEDLTIDHNRIEECVQSGVIATLFDEEAIGGIVLRQVVRAQIHANHIERNGIGKLPACGVFLHTFFSPVITDNVIRDNGTEEQVEAQIIQGGIVARLVVAEVDRKPKAGKNPPWAGQPGIVVNDNVVVSPAGQALLIEALGSVMVADNALSTLEAWDQPIALTSLGRCVFIMNLGRAIEMGTAPAYYGIAGAHHHEFAGRAPGTVNLGGGFAALLGFPDGRTLFHGNQVTFSTEREYDNETAAVLIAAPADDVSLQDNQITSHAPNGLLYDVMALGLTARASGNRISELVLQVIFSYFSNAQRNIATTNQTTHCMLVGGPAAIDEHNHVLVPYYCNIIDELFKLKD